MIGDTFFNVLSLVRQSMDSTVVEEISINDWDALFTELNDQAISAIPVDILSNIIPSSERSRLLRIATISIMTTHKHLAAQDLLGRLFRENELPYAIIKGLAMARYYPQPEYRTLGDIDIVVLHEDYNTARRILLENGFLEIKCPYEKHDMFSKKGITFELHKYFASTNDIKAATIIENFIQEGIQSPVHVDLNGHSFPVLPPTAEGLMLLEHMSQHLEDGIGLRHIIDWMQYVSHELNDTKWENEFRVFAEAAGLRQLAEITTKLCVKHLGLKGVTWCDNADEDTCDQLLSYIEHRGNCGKKGTTTSNKAQKLLSIYKGPLYWFRYLQRTGVNTPIIRKHRILNHFAWFIRLCVLAREYINDGNTFSDLRREQERSKEIESFMDKLGIRRLSKGHTFWDGNAFVIKR